MDGTLINLVAEALDLNASALTAESVADDFVEWDSLGHWNMIAAVEDHYGVEFTMDEAEAFEKLGDIESALRGYGKLSDG